MSKVEEREHPLDQCYCGDYRREHPDNGPCVYNGKPYDLAHGMQDCKEFCLVVRHRQ